MQKRVIEDPRPDELRSLAQLLAQLAEVNQRLARSHVMLEQLNRPSEGHGETEDDPASSTPGKTSTE
ncbi:MAG TPA: hypothetical protein VKW09_11990 [bacterium]|nr:hypothetical protein [bacterium]